MWIDEECVAPFKFYWNEINRSSTFLLVNAVLKSSDGFKESQF